MVPTTRVFRQLLLASLVVAMGAVACGVQAPEPTAQGSPIASSTSSLTADQATAQPAPISQILQSLESLSFDEFLEESFRQLTLRNPEAITAAGVAGQLGVRNDQLNDLSESYTLETYELQRGVLDILRSYPLEQLNEREQNSWKVYEWYLDDLVRGQQFQYYDYPLHHFVGSYHDELARLFTELQPMESQSDAEDYIARLWQVDRQVDQLLEGMQVRAELGVIPPDFILSMTRGQLTQFLGLRSPDPSSIDPAANPLLLTFQQRLQGIAGLDSEQVAALEAEALAAVERSVTPAFVRLLDYVGQLQQVAGSEPGVWRFPQGEAYYRYKLRSATTTDLSPVSRVDTSSNWRKTCALVAGAPCA